MLVHTKLIFLIFLNISVISDNMVPSAYSYNFLCVMRVFKVYSLSNYLIWNKIKYYWLQSPCSTLHPNTYLLYNWVFILLPLSLLLPSSQLSSPLTTTNLFFVYMGFVFVCFFLPSKWKIKKQSMFLSTWWVNIF